MNDPKPYTRTEAVCDIVESDYDPEKLLATVEALERVTLRAEKAERELGASRNIVTEQREDADRCIAALVRERDEARADAALLRIALENAEPIEAERDLLRAEVERLTRERDEARASATRGWEQADSLHMSVAEALRERDEAREAIDLVREEDRRDYEADLARVKAERDEARRQLAAVGGYKAWTLDRAALHERAEKAEAERDALRAEVERLRGLIAGVENTDGRCPWCDSNGGDVDGDWHYSDCPAFSARGEVRR